MVGYHLSLRCPLGKRLACKADFLITFECIWIPSDDTCIFDLCICRWVTTQSFSWRTACMRNCLKLKELLDLILDHFSFLFLHGSERWIDRLSMLQNRSTIMCRSSTSATPCIYVWTITCIILAKNINQYSWNLEVMNPRNEKHRFPRAQAAKEVVIGPPVLDYTDQRQNFRAEKW